MLLQLVLHLEQLFGLFFLHPLERDPSPLRNHRHDIVFNDVDNFLLTFRPPGANKILELFLLLLLRIPERCRFLEVLRVDRSNLVLVNALNLSLHALNFWRPGQSADPSPRT